MTHCNILCVCSLLRSAIRRAFTCQPDVFHLIIVQPVQPRETGFFTCRVQAGKNCPQQSPCTGDGFGDCWGVCLLLPVMISGRSVAGTGHR